MVLKGIKRYKPWLTGKVLDYSPASRDIGTLPAGLLVYGGLHAQGLAEWGDKRVSGPSSHWVKLLNLSPICGVIKAGFFEKRTVSIKKPPDLLVAFLVVK
jgi:hypothetical protein